jgi:hypothetical protein
MEALPLSPTLRADPSYEGNKVSQRDTAAIGHLRKQAESLKGKEAGKDTLQDIQRAIKTLQAQRRRLPSGDPFDESYKRLRECRYADDSLIGIIGSHADAERVSQQVKRYLEETLRERPPQGGATSS